MVAKERRVAERRVAELTRNLEFAEEERQGLTDFRKHATLEERHELGVRFAAFEANHLNGVKVVEKDPEAYVKEHAPD